jgi:diacylglycerol kinase family enzyme
LKSYKFIVNPIAGGGRARALMPKIQEFLKAPEPNLTFIPPANPKMQLKPPLMLQ